MRILVAEDERITRASLVRQLESWGHTVRAAEDGEAAWELFTSDEFDVVITDWEMPRLSGVELIRRIREAGGSRLLYTIMLTGRSDKADLVKGMEAGADDFVTKPFDREELRVRLQAGERIVRLERALGQQIVELQEASERLRRDLSAAARVQHAMLPKGNVVTDKVRTAWTYVPTDALAGDAVGLHLIEDRYLVAYVLDVSGHGVPAALLAVTAMHALAPEPESTSLLRDVTPSAELGTVRRPGRVAAELNRRFRSEQSDGRFFTLILCVLDTQSGMLHIGRAGHPLPVILRGREAIEVSDDGGLPIGIIDDTEFADVSIQLRAGDRVYLFSDGIVEQPKAEGGELYETERLERLLAECHSGSQADAVTRTIDELAAWAGKRSFVDDVSLVGFEWLGC